MSDSIKELKDVTEKITNLPTLPTVLTEIGRLMQDPHTTADEVGEAISGDQSLSSKVLKLVNSAFYGFPGRISTVTHAIVILGFATVKNMVFTASVLNYFSEKENRGVFDVEKFWQHSVSVGAAAKAIAHYKGIKEEEEYFIAGLLHDIGKVILNQYSMADMTKIMKVVMEKNCLFFDAEREVLGITHQDVGGWLAGKWNFPKSLRYSVEYHHYPPAAKEHLKITSVVHIADIFVRSMGIGSGGDKKVPMVNSKAWEEVKIKEEDFPKLLTGIENEIEKASVFFTLT